jgi:hypothetical protein
MAPMTDTHHLPDVGARLRICLPGGIERVGKILGYDAHKEEVRVRWVDYDLPDETIPTRWL